MQILAKIMEDVSYVNQELIFSNTDQGDDVYIYLVIKGEVMIYYEDHDKLHGSKKKKRKKF